MTNEEKAAYVKFTMICRKKPDLFLRKALGTETLEDYHVEICRIVEQYDRVAIKACHAVGKTWIMGRLALWFLNCFPRSIVITTAPTNRQVETLLWGEIRNAHKKARMELGGKVLTKSIKIDEDWYAMGFSPQNSGGASESGEQQGSAFQGFHAKYVFIIFDEATGVSKDMYTMAEGLLTSGKIVKWVCIANPTSTSSEFFNICKQTSEWYVHTLNLFNSPNLIANGITNMVQLKNELDYLKTLSDFERMARIKAYKKPNDYLINAQWAIASLFKWGLEHPLSKSKILGDFPDKSDDTIVQWESVQKALNRNPKPETNKRFIGVDVARYGDDLTVLTDMDDENVVGNQKHLKEDIAETTGRVIAFFRSRDVGKETHIAIDCTGVGAGVYDNLRALKREGKLPHNLFLHEIHFGANVVHSNAKEEERLRQIYKNQKTYMYDTLNEDLKTEISLIQDEAYQTELVAQKAKFNDKGQMIMESKDDFKGRTKSSPDKSDSLALANFARKLNKTNLTFTGKVTSTIKENIHDNINKEKNVNISRIEKRIKPKDF